MFRLVPSHELAPRHFAEFPVWATFSGDEEVSEIVKWGVLRETVLRAFEPALGCSEDFAYPVLREHWLPERRTLLLDARFEAPNGSSLAGYLVSHPPQCVCLFAGDQTFLFNRSLPDFVEDTLRELRRALPTTPEPTFPLRYETRFRSADGQTLSGTFDPGGLA